MLVISLRKLLLFFPRCWGNSSAPTRHSEKENKCYYAHTVVLPKVVLHNSFLLPDSCKKKKEKRIKKEQVDIFVTIIALEIKEWFAVEFLPSGGKGRLALYRFCESYNR